MIKRNYKHINILKIDNNTDWYDDEIILNKNKEQKQPGGPSYESVPKLKLYIGQKKYSKLLVKIGTSEER